MLYGLTDYSIPLLLLGIKEAEESRQVPMKLCAKLAFLFDALFLELACATCKDEPMFIAIYKQLIGHVLYGKDSLPVEMNDVLTRNTMNRIKKMTIDTQVGRKDSIREEREEFKEGDAPLNSSNSSITAVNDESCSPIDFQSSRTSSVLSKSSPSSIQPMPFTHFCSLYDIIVKLTSPDTFGRIFFIKIGINKRL